MTSDSVKEFIAKHPAFAKAIAQEVITRGLLTGRPLMGLTRRQAEVFRFVEGYIAKEGFSPSYQEIGDHLSIGKSKVHEAVCHLVDRGYLRRLHRRARSLQISTAI